VGAIENIMKYYVQKRRRKRRKKRQSTAETKYVCDS
jgi:hypothetical protein